tara:strand:+ start:131 stop:508 length:378 start_codon:yes stop_codon:yes gene_type:complete
MKTLLLFIAIALSINVFGQDKSTRSIVSNHVFVICDEKGVPLDIGDGIYGFMAFYDNGTAHMLMGSTLSDAIDGGSLQSGTWKSYDSNVSFTWDSTGKGSTWHRDGNSENLLSSDGGIIRNLGDF